MQRIPAGAAVLACVLAVAASGCGGSSDDSPGVASVGQGGGSSDTSSTPTSTMSADDRMVAFARCMRQHGVDMKDPTPDANGNFRITIGGPGGKKPAGGAKRTQGPDQKTQKALQACQKLAPGGQQKLSPADKQRLQDAALQYARCMRSHGIDVPDPKIGDGGMVQIMGGPNTATPKAQKIQAQCQQAFRKARQDIGGPNEPDGTSRSGS
jgi:hypothetical protein